MAVLVAGFGKIIGAGQRCFRRIVRAHQQCAIGSPELETQAALILVRGIADIVFHIVVGVVAGEREQCLGRLGELGIEQFVDFVMSVDVAENHGYQPGDGYASQQQGKQATTQ